MEREQMLKTGRQQSPTVKFFNFCDPTDKNQEIHKPQKHRQDRDQDPKPEIKLGLSPGSGQNSKKNTTKQNIRTKPDGKKQYVKRRTRNQERKAKTLYTLGQTEYNETKRLSK